jgi:Ca-activated chloride channel family protein
LLLPLAPLLGWWLLRRRRPALRYSDVSLLAAVPSAGAGWARWGGAVLRGLAVLLAILAVANFRIPDLKTRLPVEGVAITLAVDVSGSMGTPDFDTTAVPPVSRLDAAKQTFALFVQGGVTESGTFEGRKNDQIGLITFAAVPDTACPLTPNHSVLLKVVNELQPKAGVDAGTNVGDALGLGLAGFDQMTQAGDRRRKVLVLLSDGEHNREGNKILRPLQAAQLAERLGVPVYTIDCGGEPTGTADERKQRTDGRAILEDVARLSGGRAFVANSLDDLRAAFAEIDQLEKVDEVSYRYRKYHPFNLWCGLAAIACVLAVGVLERTVWRRLP